jgi:hypothetical protein
MLVPVHRAPTAPAKAVPSEDRVRDPQLLQATDFKGVQVRSGQVGAGVAAAWIVADGT